jgi:WD40 repeat protein
LVFDYPGGRPGRIMATTNRDIRCIGYSPDGRRIATGCYFAVQIWDPLTGKLVADNEGHQWPVRTLCFSEDGKTLVTAGGRQSVEGLGRQGHRTLHSPRRGHGVADQVRHLARLEDDSHDHEFSE